MIASRVRSGGTPSTSAAPSQNTSQVFDILRNECDPDHEYNKAEEKEKELAQEESSTQATKGITAGGGDEATGAQPQAPVETEPVELPADPVHSVTLATTQDGHRLSMPAHGTAPTTTNVAQYSQVSSWPLLLVRRNTSSTKHHTHYPVTVSPATRFFLATPDGPDHCLSCSPSSTATADGPRMERLPHQVTDFITYSNQHLLNQTQARDPDLDRQLSQRWFDLEEELNERYDRSYLRSCLPPHVVGAVVSGQDLQIAATLAKSSRVSTFVTTAASLWEVAPAVFVFHLCAETRGTQFFQAVVRLANTCKDWKLANARVQTIASHRFDLRRQAREQQDQGRVKHHHDRHNRRNREPEIRADHARLPWASKAQDTTMSNAYLIEEEQEHASPGRFRDLGYVSVSKAQDTSMGNASSIEKEQGHPETEDPFRDSGYVGNIGDGYSG
ncbi:hypothetical protein CMUS01_09547 [Colletotrichum musicola]|uniref:Uncharacterized protein n=2 Tax=Colletotrichum orchidearum species complex TaxID=2707337 RepID=A0A8H6K7H9_9PEZI|nr:hypothetical protein CMUS01_09547 [Colletotrichum musicola]